MIYDTNQCMTSLMKDWRKTIVQLMRERGLNMKQLSRRGASSQQFHRPFPYSIGAIDAYRANMHRKNRRNSTLLDFTLSHG